MGHGRPTSYGEEHYTDEGAGTNDLINQALSGNLCWKVGADWWRRKLQQRHAVKPVNGSLQDKGFLSFVVKAIPKACLMHVSPTFQNLRSWK